MALEPQWPYGPRIALTEHSAYVQGLFTKTIKKYEGAISFVAGKLGNKGVAELERIATALFITLKKLPKASVMERAAEVARVKPHVSIESATTALREVDDIISEVCPAAT